MMTAARNEERRQSGIADRLRPWWSWRRGRFWLLIALAVYSLLGFFAAPWLIGKLIAEQVARTGRSASVAEIRVNPYTLSLSAAKVAIRDTDGKELFALGGFFVNFELRSIIHWAWTFDEIRLDAMAIREERFAGADTRYTRLLQSFAPATVPEAKSVASGPPRLIVDHFSLTGGHVTFKDHAAGGYEASFGPIELEAFDLRTLADHAGRKTISLEMPGGGHIEWQGDLSINPVAASGHLAVSGRALAAVWRYANHFLPVALSGESVEVSCNYELHVGPDGFELAIEDLDADVKGTRILRDGRDEPIYADAEISLRGGSATWPGRAIAAELLEIREPVVNVRRGANGDLDLVALLPERAPDDPPPQPGVGWSVAIAEIAVADAAIELTDATVDPPQKLSAVDLQAVLTDFDNREGSAVPVQASARIASGGGIAYQGRVMMPPDFSTHGELRVEGLALQIMQPYLARHVRVDLQSGTLDLVTDVSAGPAQALALSGHLAIDALEMADGIRGERLAAWRGLRLDRFELDLADSRIQLSKVIVEEPYGRLHIAEDQSTNLSELLVAPPPGKNAEDDAPPLAVMVDGVEISDAALDFSDYSLPLPFATRIHALNGEVSALATGHPKPATVSMEGQVDEYGLARLKGAVQVTGFTENSEFKLMFENLEVSRLSPYVAQFAGYLIESGRMDVDLDYRIRGGKLEGANELVIRELVLGEQLEHPAAGSLPLRLAVALLKDANGVIDIDVPISGDLNDPQFAVSGVFWKAFGNVISKVVTAPFRLLGRLVGVDSEDFGRLEFLPGRSDLSPPDLEKLDKLGAAMAERPQLILKVNAVYAPAADRRALQEQRVDAEIDARKEELTATGAGFAESGTGPVVESLYLETFPDASLDSIRSEFLIAPNPSEDTGPELDEGAYRDALRERLIEHREIAEQDLLALADARAEAVVQRLATGTTEGAPRVVRGSATAVEPTAVPTIPLELEVTTER